MKTNSIFTKVGLGLLIAGSLAACNNNKSATTTTANTTPPSADNNPIVYVNSDSLLAKYDYAKDMEKRLNDKGSSAKGQIQSKGAALQREIADYQKAGQTMSRSADESHSMYCE